MITLHESNITSMPLDNGIGVLSDAITAPTEEELNGMFEFTMEYPSDGYLVEEIKEERIIKAKAQDKLGYQLFRIYSIIKNHDNDNLTIHAQHITYDLGNNFIEALNASGLTKQQVMQLIGASTVDQHNFNITSPNNSTRSSTKLYRTNPLQMIAGMEGSVLQIWGGQIERDNFNLILHDRRGHDDGVTITYEKNITGLEATFDISGLVTRIYPFVFIEATDDRPERLITVDGKYVDSEHINDYEKIHIEPIDYTHDDRMDLQDKTDAEIRTQLTNLANSYFEETDNDKPKVTLSVNFAHLWETEEYKNVAPLELVGMGDAVTVNHSRLGIEATAIVNRIVYDSIAEVNTEVGIGNVKARFSDSINKIDRIEQKVEEAQSNANHAITAANGKNTIFYGPDEPTSGMILNDTWFEQVDNQFVRTWRFDGIQWQVMIDMDSYEAKQEAEQAKNRADEAYDNAGIANDNAMTAIGNAQSAFDKAQESLTGLTTLAGFVDDNTGQITTIKGSVEGLQTTVQGKVDNDTFTTFVQQTNNSLAGKISMTDAEGVFVKGTTFSATIDGLQTTVQNKADKSTVTQLAGVVDTKISTTDANNKFATQSQLTQTASSLTSTITSVRNDLDELEIGGRNLSPNSESLNGHWGSGYQGATITYTKVDMQSEWGFSEAYRLKITGGTGDIKGVWSSQNKITEPMATNQKYTYSLYVKNVGDTQMYFNFNGLVGSEAVRVEPGESKRISGTGTRRVAYDWFQSLIRTYNVNDSVDIIVGREQVEKGNIATDWTPAPEDMATQSQISQLSNAINLRVTKADLINQINIDTTGILISGKKLILDGDTTVNGTFKLDGSANIKNASIGTAQIGEIDAAKIITGTLIGIDIQGARFYSQSHDDYMEVVGGNIQLSLNNGRRLDISPTGFYGYNQGGSIRFQADQSLVTSAAFGTSNSNVYLAPVSWGEVRVVDFAQLPGGGNINDYTYNDIRANKYRFPNLEYGYFTLLNGGEFRFTGENTSNPVYQPIRASGYYGNFLDAYGGATHIYVRPKTADGELRVTTSGSTGAYRDVRARAFIGTRISLSTSFESSTNLHVQPAGNGEVHITSRSDNAAFRPLRAADLLTENGQVRSNDSSITVRTNRSSGYIFLQMENSLRVTGPGQASTFKSVYAADFIPSSSEKWKTNIKKYEGSALDLFRDSVIYQYHKHDSQELEIGFITERETPSIIKRGEGISGYSLDGLKVRAIQELDLKINLSREELILKIAKLEERLNTLEAA